MAKKAKITTASDKEPAVQITKSTTGILTIPGVRTERFVTLIIGESGLIAHKFSEKLRHTILAKHMGEASGGREAKDPEANFKAARYRLSDGSDGVPAGGIKACLVKGFGKNSGVARTQGKGAIRISADDPATNLVRIIGPWPKPTDAWPVMREDVVRNANGVIDIRHRPFYWPWAMRLEIEYLPAVCSMRQVLQALAMAGFLEGLCEWRPGSKESLSGSFGTFRLATAKEVEAFERGALFANFRDAAALVSISAAAKHRVA